MTARQARLGAGSSGFPIERIRHLAGRCISSAGGRNRVWSPPALSLTRSHGGARLVTVALLWYGPPDFVVVACVSRFPRMSMSSSPDTSSSARAIYVPIWLLVMLTFCGTLAMHMFVPALPVAGRDLH